MNIEKIAREAAEHFADYMNDPHDPELFENLVEWVGQSKLHCREFLRLVGVRSQLAKDLKAAVKNSKAKVRPLRIAPSSLRGAEKMLQPVLPRARAPISRRAMLLGGAGVAASVVGVTVQDVLDRRSEDFIASGHVRRTILDGHSTMHAARRSETQVQYRGGTHWVHLANGWVAFDLSPGVRLIVQTNFGSIVAIGARFAVSIVNRRVIATVEAGRARWKGPAERMSFDLPIEANEEAILRPGALHPMVVPFADARRRLTWTTGVLRFHRETLAEMAEAFNQFNETEIRVDADVARLTIGAHQSYRLNNPEAAVRRMAASLHLQVAKEAGGRILRIVGRGVGPA